MEESIIMKKNGSSFIKTFMGIGSVYKLHMKTLIKLTLPLKGKNRSTGDGVSCSPS